MKKSAYDWISIFATNMSAADWLWRLLTIGIVAGGGSITGIFASKSVFFQELGVVAWIAVGLICSISLGLIFYLISSALNQSAIAEYTRSVSTPKDHINPLLDSFKDQIIPIEELRLPGVQLHENKHFKRCLFVGPASVALMGGTYVSSSFVDCGNILAVPDGTKLVGVVVLKNCTIEECEFHRITILADENQASTMSKKIPGFRVGGSIDS